MEFRICIKINFHIFFGFRWYHRFATKNTSLYEYHTLTLLPFYKFLKMTLLVSQPLTYLSGSSKAILDSFMCNIWKIGLHMYIWDPGIQFTMYFFVIFIIIYIFYNSKLSKYLKFCFPCNFSISVVSSMTE